MTNREFLRRAAKVAGTAFVVLLILWRPSAAVAQSTGTGARGPVFVAPTGPVVVDVRKLPADNGHPQPPRPWLHPGGQDELDRQKAAAAAAAGADPAQLPLAIASAAILNPTIGFDGINSSESYCGCMPPDAAIAVGPTHVVAATNTAFKIWDKSGGAFTGYPKSLASLFSNPSCLTAISDPFAEYDVTQHRFVLGALTYDAANNSSICVAVSQTGDPTAQWYVYAFPNATANVLLDFPHAAIGSDAIYLSGNQFDSGENFLGARVYAYRKAQMYAGLPASAVFFDIGNNAAGRPADTLTPVRSAGLSDGAYFIDADNGQCPCTTITVWQWTDPFGGSTFDLRGGVTVTAYDQPPNAPQLGGHGQPGMIATNDARNLAAHGASGTIFGTHAIGVDPGGGTVAGVQWYQIGDIETTPALIQQGVVASAGRYRFYPSLAVDRLGGMFLGYAISSASEYAGISYSGRLPGDSLGTLQSEGVLKAGETTVSPSSRYGDYAADAVDPDGCRIWHFEEYARAGSAWGTWIGGVRFDACVGAAVGGIAEQPDVTTLPSAASGGSGMVYIAGATAASFVAAAIGVGWRRRRRRVLQGYECGEAQAVHD